MYIYIIYINLTIAYAKTDVGTGKKASARFIIMQILDG